MKTENYEIVGSDNFWYGSALKNMNEVKERVKEIKKNVTMFANPETEESQHRLPQKLYIIKGKIVKEVQLKKVI